MNLYSKAGFRALFGPIEAETGAILLGVYGGVTSNVVLVILTYKHCSLQV